MRVLGLFSGIGGFELGMERAGHGIVGMCEIDTYCRRVLSRHWPGVPLFDDVRGLTGLDVRARCGHIDIITGGFPCQDISLAGRGAGITGPRSGLWFEMLRLISEIRPAWVVAENVSALRGRGLGEVLRASLRSGMMRSGTVYPLAPLALLTDGTESGSSLPTPTARCWKRGGFAGQLSTPAGPGGLNPTWVEWLMGFPIGWTDCGPSETRSFRRSRR